MISGRVDPNLLEDFPQLLQVLGGEDMDILETAHIMPVVTTEDLENAKEASPARTGQEDTKASVWTVLKSFGYDVIDAVNEEGRLDNLMTLSATMHEAFNRMRLWLEEVPGKVRGCSQSETRL